MKYIDYLKKYHNIDLFIVLMDELGYSDDEIITKLETSKGNLYNAKGRLEPLLEALKNMDAPEPVTYGDPEINAVIEAFKISFGTTKASQYDRYAAKRLYTKHGAQNIVTIIEALASYGGDKYAPAVNSVRQLEEKWVSVGKFLNNKSNNIMVEL